MEEPLIGHINVTCCSVPNPILFPPSDSDLIFSLKCEQAKSDFFISDLDHLHMWPDKNKHGR